MMIPPRRQLSHLFESEDDAISFLEETGVIIKPNFCPACKNFNIKRKGMRWRCSLERCQKSISILKVGVYIYFKGTFFDSHKLKVNEILELGYCWLLGMNNLSIQNMTGRSNKTVIAIAGYFRQLVGDSLDLEDTKIGVPGVIVEVDEAKFGKRKYNRGHRVDGAWVLGGVERTQERKVFLVEVPDRKQETLLGLISNHIQQGSIVHTDCFKSYSKLNEIFGVSLV
jgi:ISXO2-like transposase domain